MNNMKINEEALSQELAKLTKKKEELNEILDKIKEKNEELKDCWETDTSESVFTNFEDFFKYYQNCVTNLQNDIQFLDTTIKNYKEFESKTNKEINEKIAL